MNIAEIIAQFASALLFVGVITAVFLTLNVNIIVGMAAGFFGYAVFCMRAAFDSRKRLRNMNIKIR